MRAAGWIILALALPVLLGGCKSTPENEGADSGSFAPLPPSFLTGPAALLFTNANGFSAHVSMTTDSPYPSLHSVSGELLGREGKLLFAPGPSTKEKKKNSRGGFLFVWDMKAHQGFVVSDALQGYAPYSSSAVSTNLQMLHSSDGTQAVDGHLCEPEDDVVEMSDGTRANFRVLRASNLRGFPLRITFISSSAPFTLALSKVKLEPPASELFAVPNDFTKYSSAETLMTELVVRQHNLKRKPDVSSEPLYDSRQRR